MHADVWKFIKIKDFIRSNSDAERTASSFSVLFASGNEKIFVGERKEKERFYVSSRAVL